MAASAWVFYNEGKKNIGNATIDLDTDQFYLALFQSASDVTTVTQSALAELSGQVLNANGYTTGGKSLTVTWTAGASASEFRFDATAVIWSASGGNIANVRYAVVYASGGNLVCYAALSTAQFTVTDGNTLTVTPSANGIFELN